MDDVKKLQEIWNAILQDPRYQAGLDYGKPRPGHPEGSIHAHIDELDQNLDRHLAPKVTDLQYWKLRILVYTHDTFKKDAIKGTWPSHPENHGHLARTFLSDFTSDRDLLTIVQYHDLGYYLWKSHRGRDSFLEGELKRILDLIIDHDLYAMFTILDTCVPGKNREPLRWFLTQLDRRVDLDVDENWIW